MLKVKISGIGSYLPERVVTNDEIAAQLESSDEWIFSHTGIKSRHVASPNESASSLGVEAAKRAMEKAGATPEEIGLIILGTTTPDYLNYPSTACIVQKELGCVNAAAFDLAAACSGFVYGLEMGKCYLLGHPKTKVLVIGSEVLTRHQDWRSRSTAMIFGDAAGAAVLETEEVPEGTLATLSANTMGADGDLAIHREGGARLPPAPDHIHDIPEKMDFPTLKMDGHAVFKFAVSTLDRILVKICDEAGIEPAKLDRIFAHQANTRILDSVARRMKLPNEMFYTYLAPIGNTSSASIPVCLDKALREGELKDGMKIAVAGFGAGLTWAASLIEWPYL